jgi:hypothetical protein
MIPCPAVSTYEFTSNDPQVWDEKAALGPVWLKMVSGRLVWDRPVAMGLVRFLHVVEEMTVGFGVTHGTAYAALLGDNAVTAGNLHYDSGRRMPERNFLRFTATWSSDDVNLANTFRSRRDSTAELIYEGTTYRDDLPGFFLPPNRHITMFSEGLDLHARAAVPARPGQWGIFCSASMYSDGNPVDLFCPRLEQLRSRIPQGVSVLTKSGREVY